MARIRVPDGEKPEIVRVWSLRPELGLPLAELSKAVYGESKLPARVRDYAPIPSLVLPENHVSKARYAAIDIHAHSSAKTPEEVAAVPASYTGRFLADLLPKAPTRRAAR